MVFDLRKALLKKGEFETARLIDFEFRERARAMRLLAGRLDLDPGVLVAMIVEGDDDAILLRLARLHPHLDVDQLRHNHASCRAEARRALIAERGDPTPYRLG
jgi:hypothetical protein